MAKTLRKCQTVAELCGAIADYLNDKTKADDPIVQMIGFHGIDRQDLLPVLGSGSFAITAASSASPQRRAFVYGYATRDGVSALRAVSREYPRLGVASYQAGSGKAPRQGVPIIRQERVERSFRFKSPIDIHDRLPVVASPSLVTALIQATQVIVCDREWGSNDVLWLALRQAFSRT